MEICGIKVFQEIIFEPLLNKDGVQCIGGGAAEKEGVDADEDCSQ